MLCPTCKKGPMICMQERVTFNSKDKGGALYVRVFECPLCGGSFLDNEDRRKIESRLADIIGNLANFTFRNDPS